MIRDEHSAPTTAVSDAGTQVLQGTLDLMVLKTLETMGPQHGYGIARRIEQISENGRRARFYELTRAGKAQVEKETESWARIAATMARFLTT